MVNSQYFINASNVVKTLLGTPTNDEMGKLYGLYKQATVGDNNTTKPSMFDFKANKKYSHWSDYKGYSTYDAEVAYITLVNELVQNYKLKE